METEEYLYATTQENDVLNHSNSPDVEPTSEPIIDLLMVNFEENNSSEGDCYTSRPKRKVKKPVHYPDHKCLQMDDSMCNHGYEANNIAWTDDYGKGPDNRRSKEQFSPTTWRNYPNLPASHQAISQVYHTRHGVRCPTTLNTYLCKSNANTQITAGSQEIVHQENVK